MGRGGVTRVRTPRRRWRAVVIRILGIGAAPVAERSRRGDSPARNESATGMETDMRSRDNDQLVLEAIENQLRTEDPRLVDNFSDFGSITPWIKPVKGEDRTTTGREKASLGWSANRQVYDIVSQPILVVVASILVIAFVAGVVWWMLTVLSQ
jgi:Protein of unknown function (DUF3040)